MKFLDSTGLSTVVKYIKNNVPLLDTHGRIPTKYIMGSTVSVATAKEAEGITLDKEELMQSEITFDNNAAMGGFWVMMYEYAFFAFVMYVILNGELLYFFIKPIMDPQGMAKIIADSVIYMISTSNGYYLVINNKSSVRMDIHPFADRGTEDAVLHLNTVTSPVSGTKYSPIVIS